MSVRRSFLRKRVAALNQALETGGVLPDYLEPGLAVVFVGSSVATTSASRGHYYSGPGNKFWELLCDSGLTGHRLLIPEQDSTILRYGIGLTDLVKGRAASSDALLRSSDYDVQLFLSKLNEYKPWAIAFNGKGAARRVFRSLREPEPLLGRSAVRVGGSRVFVLPSSSAANADRKNLAPKASKAEWWRELGDWLRASNRVSVPPV